MYSRRPPPCHRLRNHAALQCALQEVAALCGALSCNSTLTELYASNHAMAPAAAALVGDMLGANVTLRALCVGDAAFGDDGLAALAPGLARNTALTHHDLENKARRRHLVLGCAAAGRGMLRGKWTGRGQGRPESPIETTAAAASFHHIVPGLAPDGPPRFPGSGPVRLRLR